MTSSSSPYRQWKIVGAIVALLIIFVPPFTQIWVPVFWVVERLHELWPAGYGVLVWAAVPFLTGVGCLLACVAVWTYQRLSSRQRDQS